MRNDIYNSFMQNDIENICFGGGFHIFPFNLLIGWGGFWSST